MLRNRLLLVALLAVGLAVAWIGYFRPLAVQLLEVQRDVPVQVFGLGTVEARIVSKVGFKVAGVLTELQADQGDFVANRAVLAQLDSREQAARLSRAQAGVEHAQATLNRAMASVAKAEAAYANAKRISGRRQSLVQGNNVSVEASETVKTVQEMAEADLNLAKSDVEVARVAVRDAQAQERIEAVALELHTLSAPFAAVVSARQREAGAVLAPGEPVFTLVDPATVWVLGYVDEGRAGAIQVEQEAQLVLRSQPGRRLPGRVARIEIESDRVNEERRIAVAFETIPEDFHLGEQAEVFITTATLPRALLIPARALKELKGERGTLWTVEEGRLAQRDVPLGQRLLDGRIEVRQALPEGVRVVERLWGGARLGRAVRVVDGAEPPR